jgi:pimeloyl-ACP methyl ester carboxylesterase
VLTERGVVARDNGFSWTTDRRLLAPSAMRMSSEQLDAFVWAITAPIKLLVAAQGLPKLYERYIEEISRFPHIDYELLDGGHHLHMEQQVELVAQKLNAFFAGFIKNNCNSDAG